MPTRASLTVVVALVVLAGPLGQARQNPPARSLRNASYTIEARLDPSNKSITGTGRLVWRNITSKPAAELRFHLYWNAWRDASSSWMREYRMIRGDWLANRPDDDRGWIDITDLDRVTADGKENLLDDAEFIAPDDGNRDDRTVLSVPLARPVKPGESVTVDMGWTARVPRTYARTGRIDNYYFIAHWFPKIGVLDETGWNCHQFHVSTEFFSDFGVYDVSLTTPAGWIVGATGREEEKIQRRDGTLTHRYVQTDVHDFAWTTSPHFLDVRERFEEPGLPPVAMRLLLQPEHASQADRHFTATRVALTYYGTWFGAYPYEQITIVDPVTSVNPGWQGESTGGMEYPTLFTAGTRYLVSRRGLQPESVTVHEAGHQFWYGVVATNEFEHAWMDEGLNTFSTARAIAEGLPPQFVTVERYFGGHIPHAYVDVPWSRDIDGNRLNAFRPYAASDVPATPTWRYFPVSAGAISYNKTALWLATLERHLGWPTLQRILRKHFDSGAYRHPTPEEFFATANEVSGQDLIWFFDAVHRSAAVFDYGVAQVVADPAGPLTTTVVVRRYGTGAFPIDVRVTFEDGSDVTERWDGRGQWQAFRYQRSSPVRVVEVDPNRVLLLDVNYTNNTWTARPRAAEASRKWAFRWLTWLEELLLTYAFFA